eukprot:311116-Pyramimonas_sp.AAC.1
MHHRSRFRARAAEDSGLGPEGLRRGQGRGHGVPGREKYIVLAGRVQALSWRQFPRGVYAMRYAMCHARCAVHEKCAVLTPEIADQAALL